MKRGLVAAATLSGVALLCCWCSEGLASPAPVGEGALGIRKSSKVPLEFGFSVTRKRAGAKLATESPGTSVSVAVVASVTILSSPGGEERDSKVSGPSPCREGEEEEEEEEEEDVEADADTCCGEEEGG